MNTKNKEIEGKVQLNLILDTEIAEWLNDEAADNNMTIDEVVESLVQTMKALAELKDETMGAAFSTLNNLPSKKAPRCDNVGPS